MYIYEVRPRKDKRGVDLISDALPFGRLLYAEPNAIGYAQFYSRAQSAVIPVYDCGPATGSRRTRTRTQAGLIHARQLQLAVKDEVTSSAWAGEMKLQKNERPPMRRPLRIL